MPKIEINAVEDKDLKGFLTSLGEYNNVVMGNANCIFCNRTIDLNNIHAVFSKDADIVYCCDNPECIIEMVWDGNKNG